MIVNDGSKDETGQIAADFARHKPNVVIVHHPSNQGLGQALKSGFAYAEGDYIITLDVDLSYAPYHIEILLEKILETPGSNCRGISLYARGEKSQMFRACAKN